ncbi:unnamed protein product [Linum tenue]|uniref:F-box domain-containing protein n=1 Tax=Linum tenue TaxID=586396 RepID=A0AAV0MV35_9ROSI|nr:unnamed protein product [Linum tenue]
MAIENFISDLYRPLREYRHRSAKRRRVSPQLASLPPTTISKLGEDLLVEILIRLPNPRFACRCKLVCKRWTSLISSPRFNRRFVSHRQTMNLTHPPMPDNPYELQSTILSFLPPMPSGVRDILRVTDCNQDLVLCGFWDPNSDNGELSRSYLVCNPFTKQWMALPLAPRKSAAYDSQAARLVCEPRISVELDLGELDLGDDQAFVYSEHRFRVVCTYQTTPPNEAIKLDVFCSESGEWTKEAFEWDRCRRMGSKGVISCSGELFLTYSQIGPNGLHTMVNGFNPFRLDVPPTPIDISAFLVYPLWFISSSQGALHVLAMEHETMPVRLSVWRLAEDRKSWMKQCEGLVNKTSMCCNYEAKGCYSSFLHPHKPELVFFSPVLSIDENAILCCDLGREEVRFFTKLEWQHDVHRLHVFQPRLSCWATPIPRLKGLQGSYDENASLWVESSGEIDMMLSICFPLFSMDHVMKSSVYKDYIERAVAEATLNLVAEIILGKRSRIGEFVSRRWWLPRSPDFGHELDMLEAGLKCLRADVATIGKQRAELKQALLRETSELPRPPSGLSV